MPDLLKQDGFVMSTLVVQQTLEKTVWIGNTALPLAFLTDLKTCIQFDPAIGAKHLFSVPSQGMTMKCPGRLFQCLLLSDTDLQSENIGFLE